MEQLTDRVGSLCTQFLDYRHHFTIQMLENVSFLTQFAFLSHWT